MVSREDENSEGRGREHRSQTTRRNKMAVVSHRVSRKDLERAAKPAFEPRKVLNRQRQQTSVSQKELNELLLQRAESQGGAIEDKKKEQWVKTGGVLKEHGRPETDEKLVTGWLDLGSTHNSAMEAEGEEDSDDGNDSEYESTDVDCSEEPDTGASDAREPGGKPVSLEDVDVDADKENCRPLPRRLTCRAIVDSDDEDEMSNHAQPRRHEVLAPDTSLVEDSDDSLGGDKENREELAFSVSENKENEGVPRHPERGRVIDTSEPRNRETLSTRSSPVFHAVGNSGMCREPLSRLDTEAELASSPPALTQRRDANADHTLQIIHEDATLAPIGSIRKEGLHRRSSSTSSEPEILDDSTLSSPDGFSQQIDEMRGEGPAPGPVFGSGGFSQFFSQGSDNGDNGCATPLKGKVRVELGFPTIVKLTCNIPYSCVLSKL
jgi:hypothetical protein